MLDMVGNMECIPQRSRETQCFQVLRGVNRRKKYVWVPCSHEYSNGPNATYKIICHPPPVHAYEIASDLVVR